MNPDEKPQTKLVLTPDEESLWRLMAYFFQSAKGTVGWHTSLARFQEIARDALAQIKEDR